MSSSPFLCLPTAPTYPPLPFPSVHCERLCAVCQYACEPRFGRECVLLWLTLGIVMGPGCDVLRHSVSISRVKLLPAVPSNMSRFQGKQLEGLMLYFSGGLSFN